MSNDEATQVINTGPQLFLVDNQGASVQILGEMIVGRSDESDFVIKDPKASRKHAKIEPDGDGLLVEDLGSTNGSVHEGVRKQSFRVLNGEVISFPNDCYKLKVEQTFATPEFDSDKTMPMDLSEINALAANKASQSNTTESTSQLSGSSSLKKSANEKKDENAKGQQSTEEPEKESSAWWESSEKKSDGTAVFNVNDLGANKTNVAALVKLGPAMEPRLVVKSGSDAGTEFKLSAGSFVIGKDASCDIQLKEGTVSDQHAKLVHDGHTWQLVNLLALNHTLVNDEKVQSVYLNSGDQIRMGGALLVFQLPDAPKGKARSAGKVRAQKQGGASITASKTMSRKKGVNNRSWKIGGVVIAVIVVAVGVYLGLSAEFK